MKGALAWQIEQAMQGQHISKQKMAELMKRVKCYRRIMVDIKLALENAVQFAKDSLGADRTTDIRLEEVESSRVGGVEVWLLTLSSSSLRPGLLATLQASSSALGADFSREYKVFEVAKESGEVLSMKIRVLTTQTT